MSRVETTTNFRDNNGTDLGKKLVTKDYLISVYPEIGQKIGIPPELWIWGAASILGNNQTTNALTPITTFAGGTNWKEVSVGSAHILAIKTDGTLWTWGVNTYGRLGINNTINRSTPVTTFAGGTNWKQVSGGSVHSAAIKTDGTLWVWGGYNAGALGVGYYYGYGSTIGLTPMTTFAGGNNWKQVSCGQAHTAAIKTDGTLWIWGFNANGQLGNGRTDNALTPITTFAGGTNWKQVDCGQRHTAAIKTDGTLWTWGYNNAGRLGNAQTINRSTPVTTFAGGNNWKQVASGELHTTAIKTDGTLWTWGSNLRGTLGNLQTTYRSTPVTTFAGGNNWKQVSCGYQFTSAIKTDGTLWTWGYAAFGRLGINNTTQRLTPVTTFAGGNNWKQVEKLTAIKSVDFSPF